MFAEENRHIPFPIKRIFAIRDVPALSTRGSHAHRKQHQFIIMMSGQCKICVDDGRAKWIELMEVWNSGLYVPPMVWLDLYDFSANAICLVFASDYFDEADYVRDFDTFKKCANSHNGT